MTNDLSRPVEPSDAQDRPSARRRKRPDDRGDHPTADGTRPVKNTTPAKKATAAKNTTAAKKTTPTKSTGPGQEGYASQERRVAAKKSSQSVARVLRSDTPPVNQLDFDDRHDTRATESKVMGQRYAGLHKERRKNDWHYLAMSLVVFMVGVTMYLASFVLLSWLLPGLQPRQVTEIVGLACLAGGGGVAVRSAGRALKQRYGHRRGQASDST
jgi:hypothetical protein